VWGECYAGFVPLRERILVLLCLLFAVAMFVPGITWGLPSRSADVYLFGSRTPWTGKEIISLAGGSNSDPSKGADVDVNPLVDRSKPVVLNDTDAKRAEIVRRYRLYTYQPDEWITMRSLAGMSPGTLRLDPKVYQYGGLWIYPVGAMLKAASLCGWVDLRGGPDALTHYIDHPDAFSRFYVVARSYSAAWGVVGTWAVYMLTRRMTGSIAGAAGGALCFAAMPVVVNMAHEAKPHLAGLALMLLAVLAACRFVESGATRWWLAAGVLCGAAFGMVISSLVIFSVLPVMTLFRNIPWRRRAWIAFRAIAIGLLVYAVTNPYVWINAIRNPAVLKSNLGTSTAMYSVDAGGGALGNAVQLLGEGTSPLLAGVGFVAMLAGGVVAARRARSDTHVALLIMLPALVVAIQFVALGKGKPGEYGRFALLPDTALAIFAVAGVMKMFTRRRRLGGAFVGLLVVVTAAHGAVYVQKFLADARPTTSRLREAARFNDLNAKGYRDIALSAEPAPYSLPPIDLFTWQITLVPRGQTGDAATINRPAVFIQAVDSAGSASAPSGAVRLPPAEVGPFSTIDAPISWAAKPFDVFLMPASR
jgi:hypothetical protein